MVVFIVAIGCLTGIAITFIDKVGSVIAGGKRRALEEELQLAKERSVHLDVQIAELRRENGSLQKQLEWHSKLLEAQDHVVRQLGDGSASPPPAPGDQRSEASITERVPS